MRLAVAVGVMLAVPVVMFVRMPVIFVHRNSYVVFFGSSQSLPCILTRLLPAPCSRYEKHASGGHMISISGRRRTYSVCPVCSKKIPACQTMRDGELYLEKECPEHGFFSAVVWRGAPALDAWRGDFPAIAQGENESCPTACGLCAEHRRGTCCVLVEITARCNLRCAHCFATDVAEAEPSLDELRLCFTNLVKAGNTFVQLSGGEPTMRDDLPQIVRLAKECGMEYVQLNSNGLRLADEPEFLDALAEAGLSFVFLQFDGLDDEIYNNLRGAPLFERKKAAIAACGERRIGVTLVPTLVPGVNTHQIWSIVEFGASLSPAVRGVHFQPVSYFGRYPKTPDNAMRITLPEVLAALDAQSGGALPAGWFRPSCCDHPQCGFHADFLALPGEALRPMHPEAPAQACCGAGNEDAALKNRHYVGQRWSRHDELPVVSAKAGSLDDFLQKARRHIFTISAMAFQDLWTLDLERLRQCSLHVYDRGRIVPFCSYYNLRPVR